MTSSRLASSAAGLRSGVRSRLDAVRAAGDTRWGRPRTAERPIYLVAPAGHPNHGDEQLLAGWLRWLRRARPGTPVVVDCHTPGQAAVLHHAEHPDVLFTDTLWRLAAGAADGREAVEFCRRAVADPGTRAAVASGVSLARRASVVHLVGGGYVNDQWPHHYGVAAAAGELGRLAGARVVATGQGLIPCADPALLAEALAGFEAVTVRDRESLELAGAAGAPARLVGDDGWLSLAHLPETGWPVYSSDPDTCRDVMVCAQSDLADPEAVADTLARTLAEWAVPGERIGVVEAIPGGDRVVWDLVRARAETGALAGLRLDRARFVSFEELWAAGLPAREGQVWLSTRFHAHLFAAARGASGVALRTGSGYYDVKHGSLAAAGSSWPRVALDAEAPAQPATGGFAPDVVRDRVRTAEALAGEIYPPR